jgi:c-di-GMP-binding flagellar brake protein YcgR
MGVEHFYTGLKLELYIYDGTFQLQNTCYVTQYEGQVQGTTKHTIFAPIYETHYVPIESGTKLRLVYIFEGSVYEFDALVVSKEKKGNLFLLGIDLIEKFRQIQRRDFFRFEVAIPIRLNVLKSTDLSLLKDEYQTFTKNISGGGICFRSIKAYGAGTEFQCELLLEEDKPSNFHAKVIRTEPIEQKESYYKFEQALFYSQIDEKTRDKIISYIFNEQRKVIRKIKI